MRNDYFVTKNTSTLVANGFYGIVWNNSWLEQIAPVHLSERHEAPTLLGISYGVSKSRLRNLGNFKNDVILNWTDFADCS